MRIARKFTFALPALLLVTSVVMAGDADEAFWRHQQIAMLGEVHDNPEHHREQARLVTLIAPRALVFEMLTVEQAGRITPTNRVTAQSLEETLGWQASGWPDFADYYPIFAAAPEARIYGAALPREDTRAVMEQGIATAFGADAARFGLDQPLSEEQLQARLDLQAEAHCNALPDSMLPVMVDLQRMRDALLARAAVQALEDTGGPVVVITGNGHARADWGATYLLRQALPDVAIAALGQSEEGVPPSGGFDRLHDAAAVERPDPCNAFK